MKTFSFFKVISRILVLMVNIQRQKLEKGTERYKNLITNSKPMITIVKFLISNMGRILN